MTRTSGFAIPSDCPETDERPDKKKENDDKGKDDIFTTRDKALSSTCPVVHNKADHAFFYTA